jgi:hypothetical protein
MIPRLKWTPLFSVALSLLFQRTCTGVFFFSFFGLMASPVGRGEINCLRCKTRRSGLAPMMSLARIANNGGRTCDATFGIQQESARARTRISRLWGNSSRRHAGSLCFSSPRGVVLSGPLFQVGGGEEKQIEETPAFVFFGWRMGLRWLTIA